MSTLAVIPLVFLSILPIDAGDQRRSRATATFAVVVTDPEGAPLGNVLVNLDGPAKRSARTEAGRIAFEDLPTGVYRIRFERPGYEPLEREVTAKGAAPIDVKVTMTRAPKPVAPPVAPPPAPKAVESKPVVLDLPEFADKNFVKRDPRRISPLACTTDGTATLVQYNEALAEHSHADSDEFVYVLAGEAMIRIAGSQHRLAAGMFASVPRGIAHSITPTRGPLVALSVRAGEGCGGSADGR